MMKDITRRDFATSVLMGAGASLLALSTPSLAQTSDISDGAKNMSKTALLLIDVQNDYFPGGLFPLEGMEAAAAQSAKLLAVFRNKKLPIIHIRHEELVEDAPFFKPASAGAHIHSSVTPLGNEPVIVKRYPNCFRETNLKKMLDDAGIGSLIIGGAMSNLCVDAGTRAAGDYGFNCAVAQDACAAMEIIFNGAKVPPSQVHAAFMGALAFGYGKVANADELISGLALS
jgi:nicotinamidase-related amidase